MGPTVLPQSDDFVIFQQQLFAIDIVRHHGWRRVDGVAVDAVSGRRRCRRCCRRRFGISGSGLGRGCGRRR